MSLDNEYCVNENVAIIIHSWRFSCAHDAVMSYAHREMIVKHLIFHQAFTWWDSQWSDLNLLCNILLRTLLICRIRNYKNLITKSLHDKVHNDRNQICCVTLINIIISFFSIELDTTHIIYIAWDEVRNHHRSKYTNINYNIVKEYKHCEKRDARERRVKIQSIWVISNCKTLVCSNICEFAIIITSFKTHKNLDATSTRCCITDTHLFRTLFLIFLCARDLSISRDCSAKTFISSQRKTNTRSIAHAQCIQAKIWINNVVKTFSFRCFSITFFCHQLAREHRVMKSSTEFSLQTLSLSLSSHSLTRFFLYLSILCNQHLHFDHVTFVYFFTHFFVYTCHLDRFITSSTFSILTSFCSHAQIDLIIIILFSS